MGSFAVIIFYPLHIFPPVVYSLRPVSVVRVGSSMVEQRPFKALVGGSSPPQPTPLKTVSFRELGSGKRSKTGSTSKFGEGRV